jgi:hypothetical protein
MEINQNQAHWNTLLLLKKIQKGIFELSNPMIWTIYKDNKNNLLFGIADGNIFRFNGNTFEKQF